MSAANGGQGFEERDARPAPLLVAGIVLLGIMALALLVSRWMFDAFAARDPGLAARHPMAEERGRPTEPLLQAHPPAELAEVRAWEDRTLATYGWIDPVAGVVRVPVARAVELVLAEGFPVREPSGGEEEH